VTESQESQPFADLQKLKAALIAFLNDEHADWGALSRDLRQLASSSSPPPSVSSTKSTHGGPAPDPALDPEQARDAWRQLADYLAHADRTQGVPEEVRELLSTDAAARAAEAAFNEAMTQRQAWRDFARHLGRARRRQQDQ
jgi:hypothetical protein